MKRTHYNPERRTWKGKSYRKGGRRVRDLRDAVARGLERARTKDRKEPTP